MLLFFDDILVDRCFLVEHLQLLLVVLALLVKNHLYVKKKIVHFGQAPPEYLGHLISTEGVKVDPAKVKALEDWPTMKNPKELRGFSGLMGYYWICLILWEDWCAIDPSS